MSGSCDLSDLRNSIAKGVVTEGFEVTGVLATTSLPAFTEADPDTMQEGKLDPLGLAAIADHLADLIAPGMTARMSRPRFLTAMAVCALVTESVVDDAAIDGTDPDLVFEWLLVEGLVRAPDLPPEAFRSVPGTEKARLAMRQGRRMSAGAYLKTPTVFGFNGVYRPLARALGVLGSGAVLDELGFELLRAWEREQGMRGFISRQSNTPGGRTRVELERFIARSAREGRAVAPLRIGADLAARLRPDRAKRRERSLIWNALCGPDEPLRAETFGRLRTLSDEGDELDILDRIRRARGVSSELRSAAVAIQSYEAVAQLLLTGFAAVRYGCANDGLRPIGLSEIAEGGEELLNVARELPTAMARARTTLEAVGQGGEFEVALGAFQETMTPAQLVEALLDRHEQVQRRKGKRPWFERHPKGVMVRLGYELTTFKPPEPRPYRVSAMLSFVEDLT